MTFEEVADRVEVAAQAKTHDELERVTADLPAPADTPSASREVSTPVPTRASSVFGDVRRTGAWTVPARGKWESLSGGVVLDLRQARVAGAKVEIDAGTIFRNVDLMVPEGVVRTTWATLLPNSDTNAAQNRRVRISLGGQRLT